MGRVGAVAGSASGAVQLPFNCGPASGIMRGAAAAPLQPGLFTYARQLLSLSPLPMKARPHVLVVTGKLDRGGTERHLLQMLPRLRACELDIEVFALRAGGVLTAAIRAGGVPVIEGTTRRGVLGVCTTALHLLVILLTRRPHIVHCFLPEAYVVGGLCTAWWPRLRRVMSRRSLNHYQARYPGIRLLERLLHRRMHAVLGNSAAVLTQLRAEGVDERRLPASPRWSKHSRRRRRSNCSTPTTR